MTAADHLSPQFDYRGNHRPFHPDLVDETAGAHEMDKMYPQYYEHPEYYHSNIPQDPEHNLAHSQTRSALMSVRGKPEASLNMYRAVPPGVNQIHPGDWVTPSEQYARGHAMQSDDPAEDWPVIHAQVKAKHLRTPGDYAPEFGYAGPPVTNLRPKQ